MTKIYIASAYAKPGSGPHRQRLERCFGWAKDHPGLELVHDWVRIIDEERANQRARGGPEGDAFVEPELAARHAASDFYYIDQTDVFWFLVPEVGGRGCWVEYGYMLAIQDESFTIPPLVVLSGAMPSIFCRLADETFATDKQAFREIITYTETKTP